MKREEDNPVGIKYHVKKYLERNRDRFKDKLVIDIPTGNGTTSKILKDIGANPLAFDLFPEYFRFHDIITCQRANVLDKIPIQDKAADFVICQE